MVVAENHAEASAIHSIRQQGRIQLRQFAVTIASDRALQALES